MKKLPKIFHNKSNYITNNKKTFINYKNNNNSFINKDNIIDYYNKKVVIVLNTKEEYEGVIISKIGDVILLDTGEYIDINNIVTIK